MIEIPKDPLRELQELRHASAQDRTDIQRLWKLVQRNRPAGAAAPWGLAEEESSSSSSSAGPLNCIFCEVPSTGLNLTISLDVSGSTINIPLEKWFSDRSSGISISLGSLETFTISGVTGTFSMWRIPCFEVIGSYTDNLGFPVSYRGVSRSAIVCRGSADLVPNNLSLRWRFIGSEETLVTDPYTLPDQNCSNTTEPSDSITFFNSLSFNVLNAFDNAGNPISGTVTTCAPPYYKWLAKPVITSSKRYSIEVTE